MDATSGSLSTKSIADEEFDPGNTMKGKQPGRRRGEEELEEDRSTDYTWSITLTDGGEPLITLKKDSNLGTVVDVRSPVHPPVGEAGLLN